MKNENEDFLNYWSFPNVIIEFKYILIILQQYLKFIKKVFQEKGLNSREIIEKYAIGELFELDLEKETKLKSLLRNPRTVLTQF